MTTIKDVARVAGVSFKTVSRVINREPNVSTARRERVEAAIRELDYRPTLAARQLKGQKSYSITLIMPRVGVSYVARMMIAIAAACQETGYHLNTEVIDYDDGLQPCFVPLQKVKPVTLMVTWNTWKKVVIRQPVCQSAVLPIT